jgi:hypothetical protein
MNLNGKRFDALTRVPLQLQGEWFKDTRPSSSWIPGASSGLLTWRGTVECAEPLATLAFVHTATYGEWCKRKSKDTLYVQGTISPRDFWGEVRVCISLDRGEPWSYSSQRWGHTIVAPDFLLPHIPATQTFETGQISHLMTLAGEPDLQMLILFLARTDVRLSRNGLWRIRKRLEPMIEEPFRSWLTFGRTRRYSPESFEPENLHRAWYSVKDPNPYQYGPKIAGGAVF